MNAIKGKPNRMRYKAIIIGLHRIQIVYSIAKNGHDKTGITLSIKSSHRLYMLNFQQFIDMVITVID
jgi:hypothetical protein